MSPNNNMNFMNPMMNQNNILFNNPNPQIFNQQMIMQQKMQEQMQKMKEQEELNKSITIRFDSNFSLEYKRVHLQCELDEKLGDVFERYRQKINGPNIDDLAFIYNAHTLNSNSLVKEVELVDNSLIYVIKKKQIKGG